MTDTEYEHLFGFAGFDRLDESLSNLANLAETESWESSEFKDKAHPLLHQYIVYTYKKLSEESKIMFSDDNEYSCFNTGLVTHLQEDIFALFHRNLKPGGSPWFFKDWFKEGEWELNRFNNVPQVAEYFDNTIELVYDSRADLRVQMDHIIQENRDRYPAEFSKLDDYQLSIALKGAIEQAKKRVRRNYKVAVPQYFNGRIQLLLPLCLSSPSKADLALVVERTGNHYRASTVLSLAQAYGNARLLAKPDKEWLVP